MNKRLFGLRDVSAARGFIYGAAILWIVFFHSGLRPATNFFGTIKSYGDCGVEIFFLLSGICLFFSYDGNENAPAFYKRRAIKILPSYFIVYGIVFIWLDLISSFNIGQFLLDYSLLDFWLHGLGRAPWFIAAIIVFYAAYPLIYDVFFGKKGKAWKIPCFFIGVAAVIALLIKFCSHLNIFTVRIPVFVVGCLLGKSVKSDCDFKPWHLVLLASLFLVSLILFLNFDFWWLRNCFYLALSLSLVLVLSLIYKLLVKFIPALKKPFLGSLTLEIYLCHEKIQESLIHVLRFCGITVDFSNVLYQLSCIALAIFAAFVVSKTAGMFREAIARAEERKAVTSGKQRDT